MLKADITPRYQRHTDARWLQRSSRWVLLALAALLLAGCAEELSGPAASIQSPTPEQDPLPAGPGIVCNDQFVSEVVLTGQNFSPVPIDVPNNPRTALPTVKLTRTHDVSGGAFVASTAGAALVYNGDPDSKDNLSLLTWQSQTQMTLSVVPTCATDADCMGANNTPVDARGYVCSSAGVCARAADDAISADLAAGIVAGLYDVSVSNPNKSEATSIGALAVIDRPALAKDQVPLSPPAVCVAQGDRQITVAGASISVISRGADTLQAQVVMSSAQTAGARPDTSGLTLPFDAFDNPNTPGDDCQPIPHPGYGSDTRICSGGTFTLTQADATSAGFVPAAGAFTQVPVVVSNPATASCWSEESVQLVIVPPPTIEAILSVDEVPDPNTATATVGDGAVLCPDEGPREVIIFGSGFLRITPTGGTASIPTVRMDATAITASVIDASCQPVTTENGAAIELCTRLRAEIPQNDTLTAAVNPLIEVVNPELSNTLQVIEGCRDDTADQLGLLTLVPPPDLVSVVPPLVCVSQADRTIELHGTDFLTINGDLPDVTIAAQLLDEATAVTAVTCANLTTEPPPSGNKVVQTCTQLNVVLAQDSLVPGQPDITVENPPEAGCSDTEAGLLTIIEEPIITAVEPALVCTDDGSRALIITGERFLRIDGTFPTVEVLLDPSDPTSAVNATVDAATDCTPLTVNGLTVDSCNTLNVTFAQGSLSEADAPVVRVTQPPPAGCDVGNDTALTVPPSVTITSIAPSNVCVSSVGPNTPLSVTGTGFLRIDGADFSVTVGGVAPSTFNIPTTDAGGAPNCVPLTVDGAVVSACTTFDVTIDTTGMTAGTDLPIVVNNPDAPSVNGLASTCDLTATGVYSVVSPPTITGITETGGVDARVCSDQSVTFTLTGTGFAPGATVTLTGISTGDVFTADAVTVNATGTELEATITGGLSTDNFDITVDNAQGCSSTLPLAIEVDPTPFVFFVDPPVLYNGIELDVTMFVTNIFAQATDVTIVGPNGTPIPLSFTYPDAARLNRLLVTVPSGLAPGDYEVFVTSDLGCTGGLPGGVLVTDQVTLELVSIDPSYVSPTRDTAVTIRANPAGVLLESIPRVYLNPRTAGDPIALQATVLTDPVAGRAEAMTAIVPAGLASGEYMLIVVNPSGEVGLIGDDLAGPPAVTVTVEEPPTVLTVVPASVVANDTAAVLTFLGQDFDATNGVSIELNCQNPSTGAITTIPGTNVVTTDATTASATFDVGAAGVGSGYVCLAVLTNGDSSFFEFSAVSVTNSSLNIAPWTDPSTSPQLNEARRGLSLAAGRPTATSRFLYALGGDSGTQGDFQAVGTPKTTTEVASVDVFGALGNWTVQRYELPAPRTMAGAVRVDRFVYLFGGFDGTTATNTLWRAEVLNPLDTPEVFDLDALLDEDAGLGEGVWYYRVASLFPATDIDNPSGESLPGETFIVQLPPIPNKLIQLTLRWECDPRAVGYRVYRSPTADASVDSLELLAELTASTDPSTNPCDPFNPVVESLLDAGDPTDPSITPLVAGSLGTWHEPDAAASLTTPRESHATLLVPKPGAPDQWLIYAFGGRDATATILDTYEFTTITVDAAGVHTIAPWTQGSTPMSAPRAELGAWAVSNEDTPNVAPGDVWIYIGPGLTTGDVVVETTEASQIDAAGDLGALTVLDGGDSQSAAGYGYGDANGLLFSFGGGSAPTAGGQSAQLCAQPPSGSCTALPDLTSGAWNGLGGGAPNGIRIFAGSTQDSAFFFLAGGHDGTDALTTTEQTVQ